MKFISTLALCVLPASVLAAPAASKRQDDVEAITDEILFDITLPEFTTRRNAQDPSYLDWTSDGCTDSPDNPLGFPYVPACNRHDFGVSIEFILLELSLWLSLRKRNMITNSRPPQVHQLP